MGLIIKGPPSQKGPHHFPYEPTTESTRSWVAEFGSVDLVDLVDLVVEECLVVDLAALLDSSLVVAVVVWALAMWMVGPVFWNTFGGRCGKDSGMLSVYDFGSIKRLNKYEEQSHC